jgi:type VI secretion system protein ImpD
LTEARQALEAVRRGRKGIETSGAAQDGSAAQAALTSILGDINGLTLAQVSLQLEAAAARIETRLNAQVNAILHHRRFQRLEASWRGLYFLWERAREGAERAEELNERAEVKLRILSVKKRELRDDARDATDFDQSSLFKKVYESEFGTAGGEPFNLLVGDYEFCAINRRDPLPGESEDDVDELDSSSGARRNYSLDLETLSSISRVATAAFAPFIAGASPEFFGLSDFRRLEANLPLEQDFQGPDFIKWDSFRSDPDSRFVGLALPRVLMREPYRLDPSRGDAFRFQEEVAEQGGAHSKYLWGNAAYAFAAVVMRAFVETGWFADIRGFDRPGERDDGEGGGLVKGLTADSFNTDRAGVALKTNTDVVLTSDDEQRLSQLGFIPLCACTGTKHSVFYSNASVHKPVKRDDVASNTTERMSSMLQYVLCASRFAHYLKSLSRQQIGSYEAAEDLKRRLRKWISDYVGDDPNHTKYVLRDAEIDVVESDDSPGTYQMKIQLQPHYQLDALAASLKLVHKLPGGGT